MKRLALLVAILLSACTTPDGVTWTIENGALCWQQGDGENSAMACDRLVR